MQHYCTSPRHFAAVNAVWTGACEVALVYRATSRAGGAHRAALTGERPRLAAGPAQFTLPYGRAGIIELMAFWQRRHMAEFGTRPEHFGAIAVTCRRHASLNPRAVLRQPIDLQDYLDSRVIADPVRLLDCDFPVDGAGGGYVVVPVWESLRKQPLAVVHAGSPKYER